MRRGRSATPRFRYHGPVSASRPYLAVVLLGVTAACRTATPESPPTSDDIADTSPTDDTEPRAPPPEPPLEAHPAPSCGCQHDADCVKVVPGCCPCGSGGQEVAVANACLAQIEGCSIPPSAVACAMVDRGTAMRAVCVDHRCTLEDGERPPHSP